MAGRPIQPDTMDTLPALLWRLAEEAPERPWLFRPEGLDWRWLSRKEVADGVEATARRLEEGLAGVERGAPVAYPAPPETRSVILGLALEAAGVRPLPLTAGSAPVTTRTGAWTAERRTPGPEDLAAAAAAGAAALATAGTEGGPTVQRLEPIHPTSPHRHTPPNPAAPSSSAPPPAAPSSADTSPAAPARADSTPAATPPSTPAPATATPADSSPATPAPPTPAELLAAARRLAGDGPPPSRRPRHEVTVAGHPFASPGQQLLVAWSLVLGGVLVLESQPGARLATAGWARPTLFLGTDEELEQLHREAEDFDRGDLAGRLGRGLDRLLHRFGLGGGSRPPALPFRRLHTVVTTGPAEEAAAETGEDTAEETAEERWRRRGVRFVRLRDLLPDGRGGPTR